MHPLFHKSSYEAADFPAATKWSVRACINLFSFFSFLFFPRQKEIVWLYCAHRSAAALGPTAAGMNSIDHRRAVRARGTPDPDSFRT